MTADSIKIECEEDGFHLVLQLDEEIPLVTNEGRLDVRINGCAEALHEQVNLIIGGWLAEGQAAQKEHRAVGRNELGEYGFEDTRLPPYDPREAYPAESSKHPEFHSVHANHYDNREKV